MKREKPEQRWRKLSEEVIIGTSEGNASSIRRRDQSASVRDASANDRGYGKEAGNL